ncbi:MAG: hypothetical protein RR910_08395 [Acidaminococcaceae bacterium]
MWQKHRQRFYEADGTGGGGGLPENPFDGQPAAGGEGGGGEEAPGSEGGTAKQEGVPGAPEQPAAPVVPEKYEFRLAEGLTISQELETKFSSIAKEMKLTQEQADKLLELHSGVMLDAIGQAEKQKNDWWEECTKQGLGTTECQASAKLALDTFGGSEAKKALIETGAAYNPAVWKMLNSIGSLLQEDGAPNGAPPLGQKSVAEMMFPNSNMK